MTFWRWLSLVTGDRCGGIRAVAHRTSKASRSPLGSGTIAALGATMMITVALKQPRGSLWEGEVSLPPTLPTNRKW